MGIELYMSYISFTHHCKSPALFNAESNTCQTALQVSPIEYCPNDYQLEDGQCVITTNYMAAEDQCTAPSVLNPETGLCECSKEATPLQACISGFEPHPTDPNLCQRTTFDDAYFRCDGPQDLLIGNQCVTRKQKGVDTYCPDGTLAVHPSGAEYCEIIDEEPAYTSCPPGTFSNGQSCLALIHMNTQIDCEIGSIPILNNGLFECLSIDFQDQKYRCVEGPNQGQFVDDESECDRVEYMMDPSYTCPQGTVLSGGVCISSTKTMSTLVCPTGLGLVTLDGVSFCLSRDNTAPVIACPEGTELVGNVCASKFTVDPVYHCPLDLGFSSEMIDGVFKCVKWITGPTRSTSCPEGYTPSGPFTCERLVRNAPLIQTNTYTPSSQAEEHCPTGYVRCRPGDGDGCCQYFKLLKIAECHEGFTYSPTKGLCERQISIKPDCTCPDGYVHSEDQCHMAHPHSHGHHHHHHDDHHHHDHHHDDHHHHWQLLRHENKDTARFPLTRSLGGLKVKVLTPN